MGFVSSDKLLITWAYLTSLIPPQNDGILKHSVELYIYCGSSVLEKSLGFDHRKCGLGVTQFID